RFEFLHPSALSAKRNNNSCVLRVFTPGGAMLLTGDIEAAAELRLIKEEISLKSDVLLVPHHGSKTSSTPEFIAAVAPRWAVVPVGYRSRFGHPHPDVLERYRTADVRVLRTDLQGAIQVTLNKDEPVLLSERARRGRYWLQ